MQYSNPRQLRLLDFKLIKRKADNYDVKVTFQVVPGIVAGSGPKSLVVSLRLDGEDFEIVGHAVPSDERREQAAAQATDPAEPSGEFSGN